MTVQTWILTDAEDNIELTDFTIDHTKIDAADSVAANNQRWSIKKRTLHGGRREGVSIIEIDNGSFRFSVIPTRGMGIWKANVGDVTLGWNSPVNGPVHPQFVPLTDPSGLGWLEGFDELLVRCGLINNGAPDFDEQHRLRHPLHGHIANLPAHRVTVSVNDETGEIAVTGDVDETRFLFQKLRMTATVTTQLDENGFEIHDEICNRSAVPTEIQMLYHFNIGTPQLDPGSELIIPVKTTVPRDSRAAENVETWATYPPEEPGYAEQVYFHELIDNNTDNTQVLLKKSDGQTGVAVAFDRRQLPHFTQWKNTAAQIDGYVTGLEPGTNFPNSRTYEGQQNRFTTIAPNQIEPFDLQFQWLANAAAVAEVETKIAQQQAGIPKKIHQHPQPNWCEETAT